MINPRMYLDKSVDYYIVVESALEQDERAIKVIDESNSSKFIRFETKLQSFRLPRNRNKRGWKSIYVKQMAAAPTVVELIRAKSFVGEAGHPVPAVGSVTMERILTIDPNNVSHRINKLDFRNGDLDLFGEIDTIDDGNGPGDKLRRNILQGIIPAFSLRSVVPQRKNEDKTIDVLGPGRMVCYDRVYLPSHEDAYMNVEVPVKSITTRNKFESVMESFGRTIIETSDKIRKTLDGMEPALEGAAYDIGSDMLSIPVDGNARVFVAPEIKYRREIRNLYDELF